jgi:type I site-specific restriction-modification system R (restriction) subunit
LEKRKELLGATNEVIEATKENDERKDILSGARQALAISKLENYQPPATIKNINNQLNELRKKYGEKIGYFNEKYAAIDGKNEELKGVDNDEFEQDLMEMKSLVKASKELTEVLKDVSKVNIETDSKEESTSIEVASFQQMLISVCGSMESFLKDE